MIYNGLGDRGHKLGGYGNYIQGDVRYSKDEYKDYEILLQLDSDKIMQWGDMGRAYFLIHPDDLKKGDFSKVVFSWDCF